MLVYDIEIVKAVPPRRGPCEPGILYCEGWHDHANMGISVVGAYDYETDQYRVFTKDNLADFALLTKMRRPLVGFNSIPFDNAVLFCHDIIIASDRCYDLLRETWRAAGLGPVFHFPSHAGYGLADIAMENGLPDKTGHGALAPVDWQRGNIGKVIDYCLHDVWLTKKLIDHVMAEKPLADPKTRKALHLRTPAEVMDANGWED